MTLKVILSFFIGLAMAWVYTAAPSALARASFDSFRLNRKAAPVVASSGETEPAEKGELDERAASSMTAAKPSKPEDASTAKKEQLVSERSKPSLSQLSFN